MTKQPPMTLDEARAILNRWDKRKQGEHDLVVAADRLLAEAWEERLEQERKKRRASILWLNAGRRLIAWEQNTLDVNG